MWRISKSPVATTSATALATLYIKRTRNTIVDTVQTTSTRHDSRRVYSSDIRYIGILYIYCNKFIGSSASRACRHGPPSMTMPKMSSAEALALPSASVHHRISIDLHHTSQQSASLHHTRRQEQSLLSVMCRVQLSSQYCIITILCVTQSP